jgi:hypothetical protein
MIGKDVDVYGTLRASRVSAYEDEEENIKATIIYENGRFKFEIDDKEPLYSENYAGLSVSRDNDSGAITAALESYANLSSETFYYTSVECRSRGILSLVASHEINLKSEEDIVLEPAFGEGYLKGNWNFQGTLAADERINVNTNYGNRGIFFYNGNNQTNAIRRANWGNSRLDFNGDWYSAGTWSFSSGETIVSDINRKHDVTNMPSEYGTLFDNLRAVVYKYNDGRSDRFHVGFIAQEVDNAITTAGLTRKDFAGLCIENEGKDSELWSLRYSEFIALNTFEIQNLKKRFSELEELIKLQTR